LEDLRRGDTCYTPVGYKYEYDRSDKKANYDRLITKLSAGCVLNNTSRVYYDTMTR